MSERLRWTTRAGADLLAIGDFIARDNPKAARKWLARLVTRANDAAEFPRAGRRVPEVDSDEVEVREVIFRGYRIVYRVRSEFIMVLTVFEGHRLFPVDLDVDDES